MLSVLLLVVPDKLNKIYLPLSNMLFLHSSYESQLCSGSARVPVPSSFVSCVALVRPTLQLCSYDHDTNIGLQSNVFVRSACILDNKHEVAHET